jgi:hypothetical protein
MTMWDLIDPDPAIALLEYHGWEVQPIPFYDDNGNEDRQEIPMIDPDGDRDQNRPTNYLYGIPLDRLRRVESVLLWALDERDPFLFPADVLTDLKDRIGGKAKIVNGRWYVNLYFGWHDRWNGCAIVPGWAPGFAENIDHYTIECPAVSMRDFGREANRGFD